MRQGIGPGSENGGHKAAVKLGLKRGPIYILSDKDQFLPSVSPWLGPMLLDVSLGRALFRPALFCHICPTHSDWFHA